MSKHAKGRELIVHVDEQHDNTGLLYTATLSDGSVMMLDGTPGLFEVEGDRLRMFGDVQGRVSNISSDLVMTRATMSGLRVTIKGEDGKNHARLKIVLQTDEDDVRRCFPEDFISGLVTIFGASCQYSWEWTTNCNLE